MKSVRKRGKQVLKKTPNLLGLFPEQKKKENFAVNVDLRELKKILCWEGRLDLNRISIEEKVAGGYELETRDATD